MFVTYQNSFSILFWKEFYWWVLLRKAGREKKTSSVIRTFIFPFVFLCQKNSKQSNIYHWKRKSCSTPFFIIIYLHWADLAIWNIYFCHQEPIVVTIVHNDDWYSHCYHSYFSTNLQATLSRLCERTFMHEKTNAHLCSRSRIFSLRGATA